MHCTSCGSGDAVLFIHGMPTNGMLWNRVIQQLSQHHRCFAVDLPGLGQTPRIPYGPGYLDALTDQIEALRLRHRVHTWHVVGHDAGAAVGAHYAGRFPGRVGCLALLSPAIFPDLKPFYLLNVLRKHGFGELLAPFVHLVFWRVAMRRALRHDADGALLRAFSERFAGPAGAWELMRVVRWGKSEDVLAAMPSTLARLTMPTLIVHGSRDVLPATFAQRASALIPRSSLVTLHAGHFIPVDQPKEISARLQSFFRANSRSCVNDQAPSIVAAAGEPRSPCVSHAR